MSNPSSMYLLGIGSAGAQMARGVSRAFGPSLRYSTVDTDATTGESCDEFILLGGDRLSGRGTGGEVVTARMAAEDSISKVDEVMTDVRLAVIVTALGGGTGGGATYEIVKHLSGLGIQTVVFATMPFMMEGEDRMRNARGIVPMIEEVAGATFIIPMDKLVGDVDNMKDAMQRAVDTIASGVTLFWRLVDKPGFIKLDADRIRHLVTGTGRGRFANVTTQGANRAALAVDTLIRSELLATASAPARSIVCGVLAGDDLRLSELSAISNGVREAFGEHVTFELGTVNDEETFSGRLSVVIMIFEADRGVSEPSTPSSDNGHVTPVRTKRSHGASTAGSISGRGRFNNADRTEWHGEDIDIPTFIRNNISLDF